MVLVSCQHCTQLFVTFPPPSAHHAPIIILRLKLIFSCVPLSPLHNSCLGESSEVSSLVQIKLQPTTQSIGTLRLQTAVRSADILIIVMHIKDVTTRECSTSVGE